MEDFYFRLICFLLTIGLMVLLEWLYPQVKLSSVQFKKRKWLNLSFGVANAFLIGVLLPFNLAFLALFAQEHSIGLFHLFSLHSFLSVVLGVVCLDCIIYGQHLFFHRIPFFWRFHKIHHLDHAIDWTTALRFHPVEMLFSTFIKAVVILSLGIPLLAVVIFEVVLSSCALFNHTNTHLNPRLDSVIKKVFITPNLHRIHHSQTPTQINSNFGFSVVWWDKWFNTYHDDGGRERAIKIKVGQFNCSHLNQASFIQLLSLPFKKRH